MRDGNILININKYIHTNNEVEELEKNTYKGK